MKNMNKIPEDMDSLRKTYENKVPREGTCGPTIIAYLTGKTVKEVIDNWTIPYRGYCSTRELEKNLKKVGFKVERIQSIDKHNFVLPKDVNRAIARIQWGGKYVNFPIPEKNTHFVLLDETKGVLELFDNTGGLFSADSERVKKYMTEGKITSFLII